MDKSKILSAYIFLIFATALWGGNIVAAKIASNITLEPIKLSFFRNLVVIFLLLPFVFQKISIIYSIFKKNWKIIIFFSILSVSIFNTSMNIALTTSSVISASLMPAFAPSMIIVLSFFIFNSKISPLQFIGVIISFIGFINIIIRGNIINLSSLNFVVGDIWMLACVMCWAFYSVMLKKVPKDVDNISFLFLIAKPVMLYDLSVQLSFLAVFSILIFLPLHPSFRKSDSLTTKISKYCLSSLLMTRSVLLGIWPLISNVFSRLSLETFWLNLMMVPLLGVIILPLCLISLQISLFYLETPPFRPLESEVFQLTEWGIRFWFSLMEELHKIGGWAVIEGKLTWSTQEYALYYIMLLSIGFRIFSWKPLNVFFSNKARFSQHVILKVRR